MNAIDTGPISDAQSLGELVPPATLSEARGQRDALTRLLCREREAAADFLLALADLDRRRGWERLGHASLFAFLTRDLALSNGAAWLRLTAARLLPRFPEVEAAILPVPSPPRRAVVTLQPVPARAVGLVAPATLSLAMEAAPASATEPAVHAPPTPPKADSLRAHEVAASSPTRGGYPAVEPLSADLRRLHVTVSARFLE